jgi:hypothetical protein
MVVPFGVKTTVLLSPTIVVTPDHIFALFKTNRNTNYRTKLSLSTPVIESIMSTAQGNIFLTTENLAFSLPLIVVCGTYVRCFVAIVVVVAVVFVN